MLSRRRFAFALGTSAATTLFSGTSLSAEIPAKRANAERRRRALLAALATEDAYFDRSVGLVHKWIFFGDRLSPNVSRFVYPISDSLTYGVGLLDSRNDSHLARAEKILTTVLSLQNRVPTSPHLGLWPAFLEEPHTGRPPWDSDLSDWCGVQLLAVWIDHRQRLGTRLSEQIRSTILLAAGSAERRLVAPLSARFVLRQIYLLMVAAQEFQGVALRTAARERWLLFHASTQGPFPECLDPVEILAILGELTRLVQNVRDGRDTELFRDFHDSIWRRATLQFHPPTQQWAGPLLDSSQTDLRNRPAFLATLELATGGQVGFFEGDPLPLSIDACRLAWRCPSLSTRQFAKLSSPRQTVEMLTPRVIGKGGGANPILGTTWMDPLFAMGSVNRGDFGNEHRPLRAYWGRPRECTILQVRLLRNDRDFPAGQFFSVQHQGHVLAAVTLATDVGFEGANLNPSAEARFRAWDLRLRFELGGQLKNVVVRRARELKNALVLQDETCRFVMRILGDQVSEEHFVWSYAESGIADHVDAVGHSGTETEFDLGIRQPFFLCFSLQAWPLGQLVPFPPAAEFTCGASSLLASLAVGGRKLELSAPVLPGPAAELHDAYAGKVTSAK